MFNKIFFLLVVLYSNSCVSESITLTADQRKIEEARINDSISENLDWHNLDPKQLDGLSDDERWLFGAVNQSILLSKKNHLRFGVFESFDEENNPTLEIRLHRKNIIFNRSLVGDNDCTPSVWVKKSTIDFILLQENCTYKYSNGDKPNTLVSLYLYHVKSDTFYWLKTLSSKNQPKFNLTNIGDKFVNVTTYVEYTNKNKYVFKQVFWITKNKSGTWSIKEPAIDNDDSGALNPVEALTKLPLDHSYDLPDVRNWKVDEQ